MSTEAEIAKSFCEGRSVYNPSVPCEYKSIYTLIKNNIVIFETDDGLLRYFNTLTGNLSSFYTSVSCNETGCLYCFSDNESKKWIDPLTDKTIYECPEADWISAEKVWKNFYVFSRFCSFDSFFEHISTDLVFCDGNGLTPYVIENVTDLQITKYGYDRPGIDFVVTFSKNDKRYSITTSESQWDFDKIKKLCR